MNFDLEFQHRFADTIRELTTIFTKTDAANILRAIAEGMDHQVDTAIQLELLGAS